MKPTIAHVITGLQTGGAELMLERLIERKDKSAFRPIVICLTDSGPTADRIRDKGVAIHNLRLKPGIPNPIAIAKIRSLLRRENAVVAQTWLYHSDLLGGLAARSANIPVAWGIHSGTLDPAFTKRSILLTARACQKIARFVPARIVCCSESTRSSHLAFGYPDAKLIEIPNGFDLTQFKPDLAVRKSMRAQLGIDDEAMLIGIIGRFVPLKNHRMFVEAAAIAARSNPNLRFVMIGDGLAPDNAELMGWIKSTEIADRFHLMGRRSDTTALLNALDLFALTSNTEALPLVLGEAMATGVPCIATDVGDSARIVGETGRIVPTGDTNAFAAAMIDLASLAPSDRMTLAAATRDRIATNFDIEDIAARYESLWQGLADRSIR